MKNRVNLNNPEIKGTALINNILMEKGVRQCKYIGSKKALNRMLKMILDSAKKLSRKLSPTC